LLSPRSGAISPGKGVKLKNKNLKAALRLVDKMDRLTEGERNLLKKRIPEAAGGDDFAKGYVVRFLYDGKVNRQITGQILDLIG